MSTVFCNVSAAVTYLIFWIFVLYPDFYSSYSECLSEFCNHIIPEVGKDLGRLSSPKLLPFLGQVTQGFVQLGFESKQSPQFLCYSFSAHKVKRFFLIFKWDFSHFKYVHIATFSSMDASNHRLFIP